MNKCNHDIGVLRSYKGQTQKYIEKVFLKDCGYDLAYLETFACGCCGEKVPCFRRLWGETDYLCMDCIAEEHIDLKCEELRILSEEFFDSIAKTRNAAQER